MLNNENKSLKHVDDHLDTEEGNLCVYKVHIYLWDDSIQMLLLKKPHALGADHLILCGWLGRGLWAGLVFHRKKLLKKMFEKSYYASDY